MSSALQAVALFAGCIGVAMGALQAPSSQTQDPAPKETLTERMEAAKIVWEKLAKMPIESLSEMDTRALWSHRLAQASIDAGALTARKALAEHLTRMETRMTVMQSLERDGRAGEYELAFVRFHVAEARRLLAQAQGK